MAEETPVAAPTPEPVEEESLAEHSAVFGPRRDPEKALPTEEAPIEGTEPVGGATEGERDAQGRFRVRHRARKDQASPEDVPRIKELTKKLRETEAERDRLKTASPAAQPAVVPRETPPPAAAAVPQTPQGLRPKPKPEDFQTYEAYLDDRDKYNREVWASEERVRQDNARIVADWNAKTEAAAKVHPDFEAVALKAPTKIPAGSFMDMWIMGSTAGAELLYHFQTDESDRERIAALPPIQQAEALALLGQRLSTAPQRSPAASVGSAATHTATPVARPPNPTRTGPMRTGDEPPGDDASIADHRKAFGQALLRRRP